MTAMTASWVSVEDVAKDLGVVTHRGQPPHQSCRSWKVKHTLLGARALQPSGVQKDNDKQRAP
jgi:hypothetical protein